MVVRRLEEIFSMVLSVNTPEVMEQKIMELNRTILHYIQIDALFDDLEVNFRRDPRFFENSVPRIKTISKIG